jgi:2-phosphosulfolactate phosphatase
MLQSKKVISNSTMEIEQLDLHTCGGADDCVVVIDVCRAFSSAAYAFAAGARQIYLAGSVQEALQLKRINPGWLAMGEVDGLPVDGFDLWNSPAQVSKDDLSGKTLILRTTAGTQGMLRCGNARHLLAGSFVIAKATVKLIQRLAPQRVSFIITGTRDSAGGEEDIACADYMTALLRHEPVNLEEHIQKARKWDPARISQDPSMIELLREDLECCLQVDRFDFSMQVFRRDGRHVMEQVYPISG